MLHNELNASLNSLIIFKANFLRCCSSLRKGNTIPWTAYSHECLRILETEKEFESDALLVQLVKLRLISERVKDLPWSGATAEGDTSTKPPAMFYLNSLEAQLQDFESNIPGGLSNNSKQFSS
jgi:hypothetical protein